MGVSDLRLMRSVRMIVILEVFRGFVMMPRCLFVMVRCEGMMVFGAPACF
jgi:hypothetical protein